MRLYTSCMSVILLFERLVGEDEEEKMEIDPSVVGEETHSETVMNSESEREQRAATLRADRPLEERQAEFKQMLLEREV